MKNTYIYLCPKGNKNNYYPVDLPIISFEDLDLQTYGDYPKNEHHFRTVEHYFKILPKLNSILNFGYNPDDFILIPKLDGKYDISYFVPKISKEYLLEDINGNNLRGKFYNVLTNFENPTTSGDFLCCCTGYHKILRGAHECVHMQNLGANNGRNLCISCDSHMIPSIPVLSYYFNSILAIDNRGTGYKQEWLNDIQEKLYAFSYSTSTYPTCRILSQI